jgi:hypothetical protein
MPEITEKKVRRTKSSRDLCDSEAAQAVPQHILNIVKNVEKRAKKSKKGKQSADFRNKKIFLLPFGKLNINFVFFRYLFLKADVHRT